MTLIVISRFIYYNNSFKKIIFIYIENVYLIFLFYYYKVIYYNLCEYKLLIIIIKSNVYILNFNIAYIYRNNKNYDLKK